MIVRLILWAGALAVLCCRSVGSVSQISQVTTCTPGFISGFGTTTASSSRKRPRGCSQTSWKSNAAVRSTSAVVIHAAAIGSFVAKANGRRAWLAASTGESGRRYMWGAGGGARMGIQFNPPEWEDLVHGFAQAVLFGILGGVLPKLTRDRLREKEAGLEADEGFEMGVGQGDDEDEFGYAEGYVCDTCDNSNEVECDRCRGKGFFVSEAALPKKCGYCAGLGTVECPECDERREMLRRERARRRPPLRLPPARDDDFPLGR